MHNFYDHYLLPIHFMASNSILRIRIILQHFVSFIFFCFLPTNKRTEVTRIFSYTCTSIHRVDRWSSRARRCFAYEIVASVESAPLSLAAITRLTVKALIFRGKQKVHLGGGEEEEEEEDFIFQSTPNSLTMCIVNLRLFRARREEGGRS